MYTFFLIFGLLTLIGGVMGYLKARSVASLVAGGVSGLLLLLGDYLAYSGQGKVGLAILLIVSLALLGRFLPALLRGKLNPAAYIAPLSLVGVVLAAMALFGGHA